MPNKDVLIGELKRLLEGSKNKDNYEKELAKYSPAKQQEIYEFLNDEIDAFISFCLVMDQIKNDPDTTFGSLHS